MLEPLIDIIDRIDDILGDNIEVYLNLFRDNFTKYLNQVLLEKTFLLLADKSTNKDNYEVLKFELYTIFIFLAKGSFEAKVNSKLN